MNSDLLLKATKLRWLQAPQAAPPAGYYYPELIAHSVVVTNFRANLMLPLDQWQPDGLLPAHVDAVLRPRQVEHLNAADLLNEIAQKLLLNGASPPNS